jgi:hypothetical protein
MNLKGKEAAAGAARGVLGPRIFLILSHGLRLNFTNFWLPA